MSRNCAESDKREKEVVTSRKGRVSRNVTKYDEANGQYQSRPARGV